MAQEDCDIGSEFSEISEITPLDSVQPDLSLYIQKKLSIDDDNTAFVSLISS